MLRKDAHLAEMKYMLRIPLGREECAKRILFYELVSDYYLAKECTLHT